MRRLALAAVMCVAACDCDEPTEEERLRAMIDTTSVHLYVAMKIAVTKSGTDPEVQRIRAGLLEAATAIERLAREREDEGAAVPLDEAVGQAFETGGDMLSLARALYELRAEGAEIVRTGREDSLSPVLPLLLAERAPELLPYWDMNTEHGVILLAMFVLKFHEKSPAPIPIEVLLYEAWMTDAGALRLAGLAPPVRAVKAHVYAQRDLCDLAKAETDALADADPQRMRDDARATMDTIGSSPTDEEIRSFVAASRALGHGSTALCYLSREEKEKAHEELQRFVDAAEEAGISPADTALLRAYLAYEDGDIDATRRYLEQAKESEVLDEDDREEIDALLRYLREEEHRDALTDFYDKAFFAAFTARLCLRQLERSGVVEDLEGTPVYSAAYGWVVAAARTIETTRNAVPSFSDATEQGKSFLESLFD